MGWTSTVYRKATMNTFTSKDAFDFVATENRAFEFAAFHFVPAKSSKGQAEVYAIMRHRERMKTFICCTIIQINNGEIYWKDIEESCGPSYYNCPAKFFQFVKAPNQIADSWRKKCEENNIEFVPISEVA